MELLNFSMILLCRYWKLYWHNMIYNVMTSDVISTSPVGYNQSTIVMHCPIWFHLYNSKNGKNTHGGVLTLVKLQAEVCNFTRINTPPWVFFTFFKLYKWYQIAQGITVSELLIRCLIALFLILITDLKHTFSKRHDRG